MPNRHGYPDINLQKPNILNQLLPPIYFWDGKKITHHEIPQGNDVCGRSFGIFRMWSWTSALQSFNLRGLQSWKRPTNIHVDPCGSSKHSHPESRYLLPCGKPQEIGTDKMDWNTHQMLHTDNYQPYVQHGYLQTKLDFQKNIMRFNTLVPVFGYETRTRSR